jgi:hypothetical protein
MSPAVPQFPPRPLDTTADAERVQVELLRAASVGRRLQIAWSLSAHAIAAARRAIARANPAADSLDQQLRFLAVHYGEDLARAVAEDLARRAARP